VTEERREFQRLHLTRPADGWFGDYSLRLLDVSAKGALVEHENDIPPGARALLRFFWRGTEVELMAETVRYEDGRSGLAFVERNDLLISLIEQSANELLRAQEANALGLRDMNVIGGDETLTAASAGVHSDRLEVWTLSEDGTWSHRAALLPDHPENGFTVSSAESPEQVELLRRNFESGDAEGRRIIRMLAELSVAKSR
jgi:hypothetical protein